MALEYSMPGIGFTLGVIGSAHPPLSSNTTGQQTFQKLTSPSGQVELEDTLHSMWGCDSAPSLGIGKPSWQNFLVEDLNQTDHHVP